MLVRITNSCRMGCTHCLVDATPDGAHMSEQMFEDVLRFTRAHDHLSLLISGGEPTEHPECVTWIRKARKHVLVTVLSNGMFLEDSAKTKELLDLDVSIQISNDPRYYSKSVRVVEHPRLHYVTELTQMTTLGRAKGKYTNTRKFPTCFNLRIIMHQVPRFNYAVHVLRNAGKFCTPSIDIDGTIRAGESNVCGRIGHVTDSSDVLGKGVLNCSCFECFPQLGYPKDFEDILQSLRK